VGEQYAGQTGPCGKCGKTITVPQAGGAPPAYPAPRASSSGPTVAVIVVVAVVVGILCLGLPVLIALLLPAVQASREAARRMQCSNNLKQIGLGMHNYHDTYMCFPAAVLTDEDGQPMRSWRVAILPFIEQAPLHDQYDYSEPWDGPNNRALHSISLPAYDCPSDPGSMAEETSYVMIIGERTIGGTPNETVEMAHVRDGLSNTILAIEVAASGIHWMEPRDMTVDEAIDYITNPEASGQRHAHPGGVNVLFCDGSVHFISQSIDPQTLRLLLTRNDGQPVRIP
jgi:prepilin-type processing-associated H-X9-DG protein